MRSQLRLLDRLNAAEMLVDVEKSAKGTDTQWLAESGIVDLFILLGPSPKEVLPLSNLQASEV